ncbi:MAG TPA: hypothetical protein VHR66_01975, partial [Gemmataceae bacterium]|nr:hypothetical protein [Gemmataceae bacterium]
GNAVKDSDMHFAPKGLGRTAQGSALGNVAHNEHVHAEGVRPLGRILFRMPSELIRSRFPGRCPGLSCPAPSGQNRVNSGVKSFTALPVGVDWYANFVFRWSSCRSTTG